LAGADESGLGECSCDDDNASCRGPVVDSAGNLRQVADVCLNETTCACTTELAACELEGNSPDCCGGACTDLHTDPDNCGACGKSCGVGNSCQAGACECTENSDCWGDGGDANNPNALGNQCPDSGLGTNSCVCVAYLDDNLEARICPLGSFCCFNGGPNSVSGCCSVPCGEATADDCSASAP
jgi:hypothetical protein